ncbi:CLUMA_CG009742, isoform A [Clunio marinus]|uniref:CLUMA_CG009742, isoform A n=1 Tax=Clunio marinus TaxID=568069 RepID=A0A1J1I803_9DIPT|nr:CLUMA_CG009742, isoform A [Clunio marinus]
MYLPYDMILYELQVWRLLEFNEDTGKTELMWNLETPYIKDSLGMPCIRNQSASTLLISSMSIPASPNPIC